MREDNAAGGPGGDEPLRDGTALAAVPAAHHGAHGHRPDGDLLEHPALAFDFYAKGGVTRLVCEEEHMGSRAVALVCRDVDTARTRFGATDGATGAVHTRTVVKPLANLVKGRRGWAQPGIKVRGREYLRIIYGPDYTEPGNLERLRDRQVGHKRSMAARVGEQSMARRCCRTEGR